MPLPVTSYQSSTLSGQTRGVQVATAGGSRFKPPSSDRLGELKNNTIGNSKAQSRCVSSPLTSDTPITFGRNVRPAVRGEASGGREKWAPKKPNASPGSSDLSNRPGGARQSHPDGTTPVVSLPQPLSPLDD